MVQYFKKPNVVVIGSLNMDLITEMDNLPNLGETIHGKALHFLPGGKGANQAVGLSRLGAITTMIGAVGNDNFGKLLQKTLLDAGIKSLVKVVDDTPTGTASVFLAEGDNCIVIVGGANEQCTPSIIRENEYTIAEADIVLLQLEIPMETVIVAAKTAKKYGKTVVLNPTPVRNLPEELLKNVDVLVPNESELFLLSDTDIHSGNLEEAMKRLLAKGVNTIIVTLGANGAAYMQKGYSIEKISAYDVKVVDTTGAGDAFNAALSYCFALQLPIKESVIFASKVAALSIQKLGAQAGMPLWEEVQEFFG